MLVTLTNVSGAAINGLDLAEDGIATGGNRSRPLPYPFSVPQNISSTGALANSAAVQLAVHPRDMNRSLSQSDGNGDGQPPGVLLTALVQQKVITLAIAAQTGRIDFEELFIAALD